MAFEATIASAQETMDYREIWYLAVDSFRANKVRFALTALGMVIGTASLILVVTIGLTGKQFVLGELQGIGSNMIYAYYEAGGNATINTLQADALTADDINAVRNDVPGIIAASPMLEMHSRIPVGGGRERDILVLGVSPDYRVIRNLIVPAGRFFDDQDATGRSKVAVITPSLATKLFGSPEDAVGQTIKIEKLSFTIVGVFRERTETFGQSEVADDTILIPYTVARYFTETDAVKQLFFSMADSGMVPSATTEIARVLQARHRPESVYRVENLAQLLTVANQTANALTLVLLLVATVTLVVSGVGIMNIMLANVRARIREIGVRKAVGATRKEIRLQFLTEAVMISLAGGVVGIVIGLIVPFSVRLFTAYHIPVSGWSVIIALAVASLVGIVFGTLPATRAAQMDPVSALHYE